MSVVFVSGPTGCIGSATLAYLLDHGAERVVGFSRRGDWSRIAPAYRDRIELVEGDITDSQQVFEAIAKSNPDRIIHLAAFQTPECQAKPLTGMEVNVEGTLNMFRAAATLGSKLKRFVFASSAAVYGARSIYPDDFVFAHGPFAPPNLYGHWKIAGEGMAQAFQLETGTDTVSIRLATTYGPGRDQGLTSAPTTALKALAQNQDFAMPYQGREHYHFVTDVAAGFAQAAMEPFEGYGAFNLRGQSLDVREFLALAQSVGAEMGLDGQLTIAADATTMPFVCDLDDQETLASFPNMPITPLSDGIRISLHRFREK